MIQNAAYCDGAGGGQIVGTRRLTIAFYFYSVRLIVGQR